MSEETTKLSVARRLREARVSAGCKSQKAAVLRFGWTATTYRSHEGGLRGFKREAAQLYADSYGVSLAWLLTGDVDKKLTVSTIPVFGEAAGGVWLEGDDRPLDSTDISVIPNPKYSLESQYARRIKGESVSNRIPDGAFGIFVRYDSYPGGPAIGQLVDVERIRAGMTEHTVKVFMGDHLKSDNKNIDIQQVLQLSNGEDDTEIRIVGVSIGYHAIFE